ncbi:NADP-dependent oxidoreductase [Micromonospora sp. NBC_00898]|uniref:NADP-dependent oxidoreductase n=1 Tax=Micromonospora sp. NBC_00898 TaxID=2975981 RepID=UPI00386C5926|nr:NADP-dependent oxidoreductase [Micromonospora sp. NBC_00898]
MRAITLQELGAAPALAGDLPQPGPRPGEVLVRVRASSVNGFDEMAAAGMLKGRMEYRFPVALGKDFAGTVEAVGDGPTRFGIGDTVFGVVMKPYLRDGAWAELLAVGDQYGITWVPEDLDLPTAGALGLAGTAAVDAVDAVAPKPGETVLIAGATGGVGALAIQYAAAAGARVIATARPGAATDFVRQLGAAEAVDYTGDLSGQVRAVAPDGVPAVVHLAGDGAQLAGLLTPDGRLASTIGFGPDQHPAATSIMASPEPATLDRLAGDVVAGRLRVPITRRYDLAEVPQALADFSGALGKLGVTLS